MYVITTYRKISLLEKHTRPLIVSQKYYEAQYLDNNFSTEICLSPIKRFSDFSPLLTQSSVE